MRHRPKQVSKVKSCISSNIKPSITRIVFNIIKNKIQFGLVKLLRKYRLVCVVRTAWVKRRCASPAQKRLFTGSDSF